MPKTDKLRSLIPLEELEQSAQQQIYAALELDFLKLLAVMPDCHTGYTLPIGGVALLDGVISPEYVGYDIGCGMCYIATRLPVTKKLNTHKKKLKLFNDIYDKTPVGFNSRASSRTYDNQFPCAAGSQELANKVNDRLYVQLGTLGGGNHFIEIGENQEGYITIAVHSGSRNPGHSVASYYMKLSTIVDVHLPKGFLDLKSECGQQYLTDMNHMLQYALDNRRAIMRDVLFLLGYRETEINTMLNHHMVNENHNHAIVQATGVLHRKGATPADEGQIGIIPGSMKAGIYVTEGLGNGLYLCSSSHGAGRKMGRKKAKQKIKLSRFQDQMNGVVAKVDKSTLDEAPDAYKDLHKVIQDQEGVVIKTIDFAKPLVNVKG